jgi:ribosomal protein S1
MELSHQTVKNPEEVLKPGQEKEFKIISIEPGEHRLGLSLKALLPEPEKVLAVAEDPVIQESTAAEPAAVQETPAEDK